MERPHVLRLWIDAKQRCVPCINSFHSHISSFLCKLDFMVIMRLSQIWTSTAFADIIGFMAVVAG